MSSTIVKATAAAGGSVKGLVPTPALEKLEEKLRTLVRLRLKIEISQELEPEEMKKFMQNESNYLDNTVEEILREIEDLIETYKLDICSMVAQDIDEVEWAEENQFMK